ncbi:hypothetical protein QW180_25650 [Vibrio sinaloensis]|nr:hypothetical protein [Vibrio sinaloensis]
MYSGTRRRPAWTRTLSNAYSMYARSSSGDENSSWGAFYYLYRRPQFGSDLPIELEAQCRIAIETPLVSDISRKTEWVFRCRFLAALIVPKPLSCMLSPNCI